MASLLEQLKKKQQQKAAIPTAGATTDIQKLMARAGKGPMAEQAPVSRAGELAAQQATQAAASQQAFAGRVGAAETTQQEAALQAQRQLSKEQSQQQRDEAIARRALQESGLAQRGQQAEQELDLERQVLDSEARLFDRKMKNREYISTLQNQASMDKLYNDISFQERAKETYLGRRTDLLLKRLNADAGLNADKRTWQKELSQISIDDALQLAKEQAKAMRQRAMWEAGIGAAQTGVTFAAKKGAFDSDEGETE